MWSQDEVCWKASAADCEAQWWEHRSVVKMWVRWMKKVQGYPGRKPGVWGRSLSKKTEHEYQRLCETIYNILPQMFRHRSKQTAFSSHYKMSKRSKVYLFIWSEIIYVFFLLFCFFISLFLYFPNSFFLTFFYLFTK